MLLVRAILYFCCIASLLFRIGTQVYTEQDKWCIAILSFLLMLIFILVWKINNPGIELYTRIIPTYYNAISLGIILSSLYGISQYFSLIDTYSGFTVTGNFDNPGAYAAALTAGYPICLFMGKATLSKSHKYFYFITSTSAIIAIILSGSRSGITGILITIVLFIIINYRYKIRSRHVLLLLIIGGTIGIILYLLKKDSADGRLLIWRCAWEMFKDKPFFGFGYEGFWANYMDYQADYFSKHPDSPFVMIADNTFRPFNEYVALIVNYGIVGFTVFISIIVILYKLYNRNRRLETNIAITCLISIGVYACFSYPLSTPFVWLVIVFSIYTLFSFANLSLNLNVKVRKVSQVFMIFFTALLLAFSGKEIIVLYKWSSIIVYPVESDKFALTVIQYEKLYPILQDDYTFLYNYANILNAFGLNQKSLKIALEGRPMCADYDMEIVIGDNYIKTRKYNEAEKHFILASNMCPARFVPLYALFKIYQTVGKADKANMIAHEIADKPIKVYSPRVVMIKDEISKYLFENVTE